MVKFFDEIKTGLALGALAGAGIEYASLNIPKIAFWSDWMNSAATWFSNQSWWASSSFLSNISIVVTAYILSILIFAIVGAIWDKKY